MCGGDCGGERRHADKETWKGSEEEVKEETIRSYCIIAASLKMSKVCFEFPITSAKEGH